MQLKPISSQSVNYQSQKNEKTVPERSAKAILAGTLIGGIPSALVFRDSISIKSDKCMQSVGSLMQQMMPDVDTFNNIKAAAERAIKDTGLSGKGVSLNVVNSQNSAQVAQELITANKKTPFIKRMAQNFAKMFEVGANAAFEPKSNTVYIGEKGLFSSVFHEIGHAMNYNSSKFMKFVQKARILTSYNIPVLGLGLFAASLFHRVKPESANEPKSLWEKTKDFVKNNAGKITFATFLPMLIEEAAASVKGIKVAKKYLNPAQVSKLTKNYLTAFSSYGLTAVALGAAVGLGNMIAQGIQEKANNK